ncbi:MAG: HAMP domain-containing protein [Firmicutes bacterium]|mgnify:CR=1 FL=1|nr:HAMP domain-containing protein [Bacillota bacterium]
MNIISRLKGKVPALGIRTKVVGIVLGLTIVLMLCTVFYVHTILRDALAEQLDQKSISIARDVAARSVEPLLTGNIFNLHQLVYHTLENNKDVAYVFFTDDDGNVLIHTFKEYFPPDLLDVKHEISKKGYSLKKFQTEEGVLWEVAVPVFPSQEPGKVARVGVVDYSLQDALATATRRLLLIFAATFVIVSTIVFFITTFTTIRPLNSLLKSVQAVAGGDLSQKVKVSSKDELSALAEAFNIMTGRLAQAQLARDRLLKRLISSQEEERRRISRELHDETGQMLNTLMISLSLLQESSNLDELEQKTVEFRRLLLQSLEQVRLLVWRLTPAPLVDLGLKAALETFVSKYRESAGWEIDLQIEGLEKRRLSPEIEICIYRVTQEALTNIARHADAENVNILLDCRKEILLLTIEDDGVGFEPEEFKEENVQGTGASFGLISMRERISLVGGEFKIISSPGYGTTLDINIPLLP